MLITKTLSPIVENKGYNIRTKKVHDTISYSIHSKMVNRGRAASVRRTDSGDDSNKVPRARSRSRTRPFARARSKSRQRFEMRDAPEQADIEEVNKFVQYKKFGLYATEISRVIAIDEIPEVEDGHDVVVKVKVSSSDLCFLNTLTVFTLVIYTSDPQLSFLARLQLFLSMIVTSVGEYGTKVSPSLTHLDLMLSVQLSTWA